MAPDALASPVVKPDIAAPTAAIDPFAPVAAGGLGLSPVGAPAVTAFGLGGPAPVPGAETGIAPTIDGAAAFAGWPSAPNPSLPNLGTAPVADGLFAPPMPFANQTDLDGPAPEAATNLAFNPAPVGQGSVDGTPPPAAPPILGYGDQPLGVPVSQVGRLTSADAQAYVGQRLDAFRTPATPGEQDAALQEALNGAYAFRVQGGDIGPFDRIAEGVAGDPRAEIELQVARDRAEAIVAAGVSGNIRALNDNGVNFGAQLYALQRSVSNDPDNALGPISRAFDALRYGEGAGSAVNDIQAGATRQALTGLGFGREVQDVAALDAARTEAARIAQRQALAAMSPAERLSYLAGQALDAGALVGSAAAMAVAGSAGALKKPTLLPGEGQIGTYRDLVTAGSRGDNLTPHHIPSANRMAQEGVSKADGIAMTMEQPSPGVGGRHRATFTYGTQADMPSPPRDALAAGIWDARRIYRDDNLYTPEIRSSLQELIRLNKTTYPTVFTK